MKKWIKIPQPGQFRGDGEWVTSETPEFLEYYQYCKGTGYLPTKEE